jgi:splicing factor 3B subunit 3
MVYVFNRDCAGNLTISSPQESNREATLCFSLNALDTGFENPTFASIELDLGNIDDDPTGITATNAQKHLTIYELDIGINSVIRKISDPLDNGSNLLCTVPGGSDGPGGLLVCAENFVYYHNVEVEHTIKIVIPRRFDLPGHRSVLLTKYDTFKNKKKNWGFFHITV